MDNKFGLSIKWLLVALTLGLLLSGCNEYYDRPDNGYDPGYGSGPGYGPGHGSGPVYDPVYDSVSDRRMIKNCKLRVENKVSRKLGHNALVDFGYVDVSDASRYQSRIEGDAYVSDRKDRLRIDYRCMVDKSNGRVSDVKLDWRNKPGHGGNKGNAASTCKSHISGKVQRDTRGQVSIDFRKHDSSSMSGERRRVIGKAVVTSNRGSGKIRYECVVNTRRMHVENANYHWTQNLPSGGGGHNISGGGSSSGSSGGSSTGSPSFNKQKAQRKCHEAINKKLNQAGYRGIGFKSTNFNTVGSSDLMVKGKVRMNHQGQQHSAHYECRVNGYNGNVKSANYKLKR